MLNLTPNTTNNLIIYADTINENTGDNFLVVFMNSYSKQTFAVVPNISKRNSRFLEIELELTGVTGANDILNGKIYLYPEGNFEYLVFNADQPILTSSYPLNCSLWNTEEEFWKFSKEVWDLCGINANELDRGQAFLYSEIECEREIDFIPYESDNEWLKSIVYVTGRPLNQFPCTLEIDSIFTVVEDTITYCNPVIIEAGAQLIIEDEVYLWLQLPTENYQNC